MVLAGIVFLFASPIGFGTDGFGLGVGGGLSIVLLNFLYRLGVDGDRDRAREEEARRYLEVHGHWPDEEPTPPTRPARSGEPVRSPKKPATSH